MRNFQSKTRLRFFGKDTDFEQQYCIGFAPIAQDRHTLAARAAFWRVALSVRLMDRDYPR